MPQGAIPPEVQLPNPVVRTLEFSNVCKTQGGTGPLGVTLFGFFCFGGSRSSRTSPHWRRNVTFHLFDVVSWFYWFPSQKPLTIWTWDFHFFHFLKKKSSDKRVLHYTYSEGTPLPARQNKALQALFFITYPRSRFFSVFSSSFSIMFRIYSPTLGHENSKTGSAPIVFFGMSKI